MNPDRLLLAQHLDLPARGSSVRAAVGNCELVFEAVRGGYAALWHAGREARRHVLALPAHGRLALELRPAQLPVRLLLRETMTLAPGARMHGYVQVPLVPTLTYCDADDEPMTIVQFPPASLAADWSQNGETPGALYTCTSSWYVRYPVHGGEARVTLPLHLRNDSRGICAPDHLPLRITSDELVELRSGICAVPRRLVWDGASWHATTRTVQVLA